MVTLKISFCEDIHKKRDSAQCDTAGSRTPRSVILRGVGLRAVSNNFIWFSKTSISRTFRVFVMIFRKYFENILKIEKWLTLRTVCYCTESPSKVYRRFKLVSHTARSRTPRSVILHGVRLRTLSHCTDPDPGRTLIRIRILIQVKMILIRIWIQEKKE